MKNKFSQIKEFHHGDIIKGFFLCKNINCKLTRLGDQYIDLFLEDSSGTIRAKIWSNVDYYKEKIDFIYPVAIKGKVILYNDNLEIDILFIKSINNMLYDKYGFNESLLFKYSNKTMLKKSSQLNSYIKLLTGQYKKITKKIISDYSDKILIIPSNHKKYKYRGGFLIQLINLLYLNSKIYKIYSLDLNKIVVGLIFKNIGLLEYYEDDINFSISNNNKIKGCKIISNDILNKYSSKNYAEIIIFLRNIIIDDECKGENIYGNYINNIYKLDSAINI